MIRRTPRAFHALLPLSVWLLGSPALAQAPQASPVAQEKAAAPAKKAAEPGAKADPKAEKPGKPDDKAAKADDKAAKTDEKGAKAEGHPGKGDDKAADQAGTAHKGDDAKLKDRLERRKDQEEKERSKVAAALRGQPMTEAMKQELERHARRMARLERIKVIAIETKDSAAAERAAKLIDKENARHDKFTANFEAKEAKEGEKAKEAKDDKAGAK